MDGARSPVRDRETGRRVSLRSPSRSGIISIHQRSKVRYRISLYSILCFSGLSWYSNRLTFLRDLALLGKQ